MRAVSRKTPIYFIQIVVLDHFLQMVVTSDLFAELANCYSRYFFFKIVESNMCFSNCRCGHFLLQIRQTTGCPKKISLKIH